MIPLRKLTRSTAFRVSMLFGSVFTVVTAGVFAVLYFMLSEQFDVLLKTQITEARNKLLDSQKVSPAEALAQVVERYANFGRNTDDIYLLTDLYGRFVAGNINPVPRFSGWKQMQWSELQLRGEWRQLDPDTAAVAIWTKLDDGFLLVGDSNSDIVELHENLTDALMSGIVATILLATIGAVLLGVTVQRRVSAVDIALQAVARGSLETRVQRYPSRDDLDKIGARINLTLDWMQALIRNQHQVSTDIAHDLRTPIAMIRQRLEAAASGPVNALIQQDMIGGLVHDIDAVMETFEALLRISEIEAGARKSEFAAINLRRLITDVADSYDAVAADAGQTLTASLGPHEAIPIRGDSRLLTQLFVNLVENAIRHCPPGSNIRIELNCSHPGHEVQIKDNGPGIPESEYENVFRRLYRLDKSRRTTGNGLGLSLVAAIANLHNAKIELADNNPGLIVTIRFGDDQGKFD